MSHPGSFSHKNITAMLAESAIVHPPIVPLQVSALISSHPLPPSSELSERKEKELIKTVAPTKSSDEEVETLGSDSDSDIEWDKERAKDKDYIDKLKVELALKEAIEASLEAELAELRKSVAGPLNQGLKL